MYCKELGGGEGMCVYIYILVLVRGITLSTSHNVFVLVNS